MARAEGFYTSEGNPWKRAPADGHIPAGRWKQLHNPDLAANRATFQVPGFAWTSTGPNDKVQGFTDDIRAIGVELERAVVEARFPQASVPASAPKHAGGIDPLHDWEGAAQHVTDWKAEHGPLPRKKNGQPNKAFAMRLMLGWFKAHEPKPWPVETDFYRWLRDNPQTWWD